MDSVRQYSCRSTSKSTEKENFSLLRVSMFDPKNPFDHTNSRLFIETLPDFGYTNIIVVLSKQLIPLKNELRNAE